MAEYKLTLCKDLTPGAQVALVGKVDSDIEGKFLSDNTAKVRVPGIEGFGTGTIIEVLGQAIDERTVQLRSYTVFTDTEMNFDFYSQLLELEDGIHLITSLS
jgi:hypothetical protein